MNFFWNVFMVIWDQVASILTILSRYPYKEGNIWHLTSKFSYDEKQIVYTSDICEVYKGTFLDKVGSESGIHECIIKKILPELLKKDKKLKTRQCQSVLVMRKRYHENVIHYYKFIELKDYAYLVMEPFFCTLEMLIEEGKKKGQEEIYLSCTLSKKEIMRQTAKGVKYLHQGGIIHRNLNPTNIVIAKYSNQSNYEYVVKITDFVLSKPVSHDSGDASNTGRRCEVDWIAPEIPLPGEKSSVPDRISFPVDIFNLGCIFHYIVHSIDPFAADSEKSNNRRRNDNIKQYPPQLAQDADFLIKEMIRYHPEFRPSINRVLENQFLQDGDFYTIYDGIHSPGLCIIINQKNFNNPKKERHGTDEDRDKLAETFLSFGYDIHI